MFKKKEICLNLLFNHPKRPFFLNYLKYRGLINIEKESISKNEIVDFKDLLDENKIKITYYDIIRDYFYFTDAYYYFKVKVKEEPENKVGPNLGFDSKNMDIKKLLAYVFIPVSIL